MSLEMLNTLATLTTTLVIAATAIAAIVQLRHLRAGNQIAGQLALRQVLLDVAFLREFHLKSAHDGEERFESPYAAALTVVRNLENAGNMIRNGLTDSRIFLEQYATLVVMAWDALDPLVLIRREAAKSDAPWEDLEYLTVLARRWLASHGTC